MSFRNFIFDFRKSVFDFGKFIILLIYSLFYFIFWLGYCRIIHSHLSLFIITFKIIKTKIDLNEANLSGDLIRRTAVYEVKIWEG